MALAAEVNDVDDDCPKYTYPSNPASVGISSGILEIYTLSIYREQEFRYVNAQGYPVWIPGKSVYLFVVWSFLLFGLFGCSFFCCLGGVGFYFFCLGGGEGPAQTAKKTRPRPNRKKKPSDRVFVLLFGRVGVLFFFAVWAEGFFCCLG